MKRVLAIAALLMCGAVLLGARPPDELHLFWQLNGQPMRWRLFDGGSSGLYAAGTQTCFPFDGGRLTNSYFVPNVMMVVAEQPTNICIRPQVGPDGVVLPWDAGCNLISSDINFGVPVQPWTPTYFVVQPTATHVCGVTDAGAPLKVPAWGMQ